MAIGLIYPWTYEIIQMNKIGLIAYSKDFWNYSDTIFVYSGMINMILQNFTEIHPRHIVCKILMLFTLTASIMKTFFFLRAFSSLSYLVTLIF